MLKQVFKNIVAAVWLFSIILGHSGLVRAEFDKSKTCPVMIGRPVKEKFFVDYNGKRTYLCCAPCVKAFKKHPEKYLKNSNHNDKPSLIGNERV